MRASVAGNSWKGSVAMDGEQYVAGAFPVRFGIDAGGRELRLRLHRRNNPDDYSFELITKRAPNIRTTASFVTSGGTVVDLVISTDRQLTVAIFVSAKGLGGVKMMVNNPSRRIIELGSWEYLPSEGSEPRPKELANVLGV